jgi:hypothetical protein
MRKFLSLKLLVLTPLFLSIGFINNEYSQEITDYNQQNISGRITLEGNVQNADGEKLEGILVEIKEAYGNIREYISGVEGYFSFSDIAVGEKPIIKLTGDKGTGLIPLKLENINSHLTLEYPVLTEVIIFHDNDKHFKFNYVDEIKEKIDNFRALNSNVFFFNSGDIFMFDQHRWNQPYDLEWYQSQSISAINEMNKLGYDALTVGNHDVLPFSNHTFEALKKAEFPLLAANFEITSGFLPELTPFVLFNTEEGYTIAVLGLSQSDFDGINVLDPFLTAEKYFHLSENNIFIALSHLGIEDDIELAQAFQDFDLIIGGHSHTLLCKPLFIDNTMIVQAGSGGRSQVTDKPAYLGMVTITLENGVPLSKEAVVFKFTQKGLAVASCEDVDIAGFLLFRRPAIIIILLVILTGVFWKKFFIKANRVN